MVAAHKVTVMLVAACLAAMVVDLVVLAGDLMVAARPDVVVAAMATAGAVVEVSEAEVVVNTAVGLQEAVQTEAVVNTAVDLQVVVRTEAVVKVAVAMAAVETTARAVEMALAVLEKAAAGGEVKVEEVGLVRAMEAEEEPAVEKAAEMQAVTTVVTMVVVVKVAEVAEEG